MPANESQRAIAACEVATCWRRGSTSADGSLFNNDAFGIEETRLSR